MIPGEQERSGRGRRAINRGNHSRGGWRFTGWVRAAKDKPSGVTGEISLPRGAHEAFPAGFGHGICTRGS